MAKAADAASSADTNRGREITRSPDAPVLVRDSPGLGGLLCTPRIPPLLPIHQPRGWNDEERRQQEAEQCVQPHQRDVEAAQPDSNPQNCEGTLAIHERSKRCVVRKK